MWASEQRDAHRTWDEAAQARFRLARLLNDELWVGLKQAGRTASDLKTLDHEEMRSPLLSTNKVGFCKRYWVPLIGAALVVSAFRRGSFDGWSFHLQDDLQRSHISFSNDPRTLRPFAHARDVVFHGARCIAFEQTLQRLAAKTHTSNEDAFVPWVHAWRSTVPSHNWPTGSFRR